LSFATHCIFFWSVCLSVSTHCYVNKDYQCITQRFSLIATTKTVFLSFNIVLFTAIMPCRPTTIGIVFRLCW